VDQILADIPKYSVLEKLDITLSAISSMTDEPGHDARFNVGPDYPLIYAKSQDEASFYVSGAVLASAPGGFLQVFIQGASGFGG